MIAREGWPCLIVAVIAAILIYSQWGLRWSAPIMGLIIWLYFLFRDPLRDVPPMPRAVVAPVDGKVMEICSSHNEVLPGSWTRISIKTSSLGAYTVRSPIEGTIYDIREHARTGLTGRKTGGLWVRSEEQDDVVLLFPGRHGRFGPKAFVRYGERVGQGQRFAYLRLAPRAFVFLPESAVLKVGVGDRVLAGSGILAELFKQ
jgi:phosphatidylserine decarboxylase